MDDGDQATVTHAGPLALVPAPASNGASAVPHFEAPESATLPAGTTTGAPHERDVSSPRARLYLAVEPLIPYWREVLALGVVSAIESPELRDAPHRTLLITDHPSDPDRGLVVAERVLSGWTLREGAVA